MEQIKKKNNIKKFIIKIILYIAFLWVLYPNLFFLPSLPLAIKYFNPWSSNPHLTDFIFNLTIFYIPFIFSPFACYIMAKLFRIFKFIDNLKTGMLKKILFLILISMLSFLILLFTGFKYLDENERYIISSSIFGLVPAFFLYKFFQYLTKKYPKPFKQIGYYCSIEFWKNLFFKKQ